MKKFVAVMMSLMLVLSLAACGGGNDTPAQSGSGDNTPSSSEQQEQQPSNTPDDSTPSGNDTPAQSGSGDNTPSSSEQQEQPSNTSDESTPSGGGTTEPEQGALTEVDELLKGTGLTLDVIEPEQEEYETYATEKGTIRFYFPSMTVIETGNFYYQIAEACKAVADDGKIYEAEYSVFNGTGDEAELALKPAEEYGDMAPALNFGYYKDGTAFTVGIMRSIDTVDGESKESLWFWTKD